MLEREEMKEKELWLDKLKEKLENYSEPLPASGWEQLEKELMPPVKKIYPYRKWTSIAVAAMLVVAVSTVSLYFLKTPAADDIRNTAMPVAASLPDAVPESQEPAMQLPQVMPVIRPVVGGKSERLAKAEHPFPSIGKEQQHPLAATDTLEDNVSRPASETDSSTSKESPEQSQRTQNVNRSHRPSGKDKLHIPAKKVSRKQGKWSIGLSVGNSGGASGQIAAMDMSRVNMLHVSSGAMPIPNDQSLIFNDGVPYLRNAPKAQDMEHHQPISVGLSFRKNLQKGFSLETGITYTLLSSDMKVDVNHDVEQKLHYLGIPLRANWNFVDKKLFTLYVSVGGMVEKCVYGKLGSEKQNVNPLQLSVMGSIGAQVNATKHIGVYIEPGVAYFFDDGSSVQTIRKETPCNFTVQGGIRFTY